MSLKLTGSSAGSVSVDAPASTTGSADFTLTLPVAVGTAGQFLKNSSTPGTLEFGETPGSQACFAANLTTSGGQAVPDATTTKVILNNTQINIGSGYDNTTGIFTVPAGMGGNYVFGYSMRIYDIDTDDYTDTRLYQNGAHSNLFWRFRRRGRSHMNNRYIFLGATSIVEVSASDTVAFYVTQHSGSSADLSTYYTAFYGYKISD